MKPTNVRIAFEVGGTEYSVPIRVIDASPNPRSPRLTATIETRNKDKATIDALVMLVGEGGATSSPPSSPT